MFETYRQLVLNWIGRGEKDQDVAPRFLLPHHRPPRPVDTRPVLWAIAGLAVFVALVVAGVGWLLFAPH
jgi:hypothetical protein